MNAQTKQKANQDYCWFLPMISISHHHGKTCLGITMRVHLGNITAGTFFIDHVDASQSECRDEGEPRFDHASR